MRSCDHRNIMILYQGFPNWGVPLVICKPLKSGTRAALCQEQGGGRSWFSADLEKTGKGCLGSECCSKCQTLPLWLFLALHQGAAAAFLEEGGLKEVQGEGGEQRGSTAHTHTLCTHTWELLSAHLPQALWCSELTALYIWATGLSCPQSKPHSTPPSLLLCSPGTPRAAWDTFELQQPTDSQPQENPSLGSLVLQPNWKRVRSITRWMRHTNPCDLMRGEICYFFWLCIRMFLCFACMIHLLVLTDTFSSVASFQVSNGLVGWIYLNICQVFISTDHQSWAPCSNHWAQNCLTLVPAVQLCPCLLQRLRLCPWAQVTSHQGLQSVVAEQLMLNARKQQI